MKHIFVSSTFRDMQSERDMLHLDVIPELNERAQKYGESVGLIDLRWGVNTGDLDSESGARKVLAVCLDEIDRSKPYMLVFLGERYGWIPDGKLMADCSAAKQYTLDDMEKSVTALEIEYGALSDKGNIEHCIFCIREPLPYEKMPEQIRADYMPESPAHQKRLESLKNRIRSLPGDRVVTYRADWDTNAGKVSGLKPLAKQLGDRLTELFQKEWIKNEDISWQEQEQLGFSQFMAHKRSQFMGRQALVEQIKSAALTEKNDVLVLRGGPGMGKSSLMSMLADSLQKSDCTVIPFVCGNSASSSTVRDMLRILTYSLAKAAQLTQKEDQIKDMTVDELVEAFNVILSCAGEQNNRLVLLIDAIDQLEIHRLIEISGWLPKTRILLKGVKIILSCSDTFRLSFPQADREEYTLRATEFTLPFPDQSERAAMISGILRSNSKGVDKPVIDTLLAKKSTENPLYLSLLLHRLVLMNGTDFADADRLGEGAQGINRKMIQLIEECPDDLEKMCAKLLKVAAEHFELSFFTEAMEYLAASRYGLSFDDLAAIMRIRELPWSTLDFTRFLKFMHPYFLVRPDGRIDFTHQTIRRGFLPRWQAEQVASHMYISEYIKTLPEINPLRANEAFYHARLSHDYMFCVAQMILEGKTSGDVTWAADLSGAINTEDGSQPLLNPGANMLDMLKTAIQAGKINRVQRKSVAEEVYAVCMADGGKWLIDILQELENEKMRVEDQTCLGRFLLWRFWDLFVYSAAELAVLKPVFKQVQTLMDHFARQNDPELIRNKAFACMRMGRIYEENEQFADAANCYISASNIYDDGLKSGIWKNIFPDNFMRDYAFINIETVYPLNQLERYDEGMICAEAAYKICKHISEHDNSSKSNEEFAKAGFAMGLENLQLEKMGDAYTYFAKSIIEVDGILPEKTLPEEDDPKPGGGLILWEDDKESFDKDWFRVFNDLSDYNAFYELMPDESEILDGLLSDGKQKKKSAQALCSLSLYYDRAGLVNEQCGETKQARNYYLYAVVFAQEADKSGRLDARKRLADAYSHLGNAYSLMERYEDALENANRSLRLYEEIMNRLQTMKSRIDRIYQVLSIGFIYQDAKQDQQSFNQFTAAANLADKLIQDIATVETRKLYALCVRCAGNAHPEPEVRHTMLNHAKTMFEELYKDTQNAQYKDLIEEITELLK